MNLEQKFWIIYPKYKIKFYFFYIKTFLKYKIYGNDTIMYGLFSLLFLFTHPIFSYDSKPYNKEQQLYSILLWACKNML